MESQRKGNCPILRKDAPNKKAPSEPSDHFTLSGGGRGPLVISLLAYAAMSSRWAGVSYRVGQGKLGTVGGGSGHVACLPFALGGSLHSTKRQSSPVFCHTKLGKSGDIKLYCKGLPPRYSKFRTMCLTSDTLGDPRALRGAELHSDRFRVPTSDLAGC